ncbi:MAG TPA: hypothetical protein VFD58_13835 [Blastocatellia bacterium]|nr:hypothetical protein [Blastocatellia bacterium]
MRSVYLPFRNGKIEIPAREIGEIRKTYLECHDREGYELGTPQALISEDDNSRIVRIAVFFRNHGIIPYAVSFRNVPGVIAAISSILSEGGFNILASDAWTIERGERMFLRILLQDECPTALPVDDGVSRSKTDLLLNSGGLAGYALRIHPHTQYENGGNDGGRRKF